MKLWSISGNSQKLDGGAMFGNAPRALWARWAPPDEHNRIDLASFIPERGLQPSRVPKIRSPASPRPGRM